MAPTLEPASTFAFDDVDAFAKASEAKTGVGYVYSRWANPTVDAFEAAVSDLEGTSHAAAFASGMGAISTVLLALAAAGTRVVAARQLYGGSYALLTQVLPRYGIEATLFDVSDLDGIAGVMEGASVLYCETIGNPRMKVADLSRMAAIAHEHDALLVVDNTFASPVLCRPAEHGADVVLHSATKFLGGHHDLIGGIACGDEATVARFTDLGLELGSTLAPFNAWLALRGIATLPLRVLRSCDTALEVARALEKRDDVDAVYYPALDSDPSKPLADALLGGRGGGTLGFDVAGGRLRTLRFQQNLGLIERAASLGGTHSLIVHAASVTHTQLGPEELTAAGISEGFCRLSIGLEDPDDLIDDLYHALDDA